MEIASMTTDQLLQALGIDIPAKLLDVRLSPEFPQTSPIHEVNQRNADDLTATPRFFAYSRHLRTGITREQYFALRPEVELEAKTRMGELFLPPFQVRHEEASGRCVVSVSNGAAEIRVGDPSTKTASYDTFGRAIKELAKEAPERLCMAWEEFLALDRINPDEQL
jgi:hypothetical protein